MSDRLVDLRAASREGDDRATAALVLALQPTVWSYCAEVGPAGHEVALVESTFLDAFGRLRDTEPTDDDVIVWVLQSARTTCATAVRKSERELRRAARSPWRRPGTEPVRPLPGMGIDKREVWTLVKVLELSTERAARVIDASLATVTVRLAEATRELAAIDAAAG